MRRTIPQQSLWKNTLGRGLTIAATFFLIILPAWGPLGSELPAQMGKPALVVSVTSLDELVKDVKFVTKAGGSEAIGDLFELLSMGYTNGLDRTRPVGAIAVMEGDEFQFTGFFPIKNLDDFLQTNEGYLGAAEDAGDEAPKGAKKLTVQPTVYVKEHKGWAYFTVYPQALRTLPDDPTKHFDGLNKQYDVAARVYVRNIPENFRKMAISQLKMGMEQAFEGFGELGGVDGGIRDRIGEIDPETARKIASSSVENIAQFIEQADQITVGYSIDRKAANSSLEVSVTAVPNTPLAAQMAAIAKVKSTFGGFQLPGAAVTFNFANIIRKEDLENSRAVFQLFREQTLKSLDEENKLDENVRKAAKELTGDVFDIVRKTLESGKLDGGVAAVLNPDDLTIVAGGHVIDGAAVEAAFKKMVKLAESEPEFPGVKYDAAKHAGVRFHLVEFPIPDHEDEARKLLGDKLRLVLGVGEKSFYIGAGRNSIETIQKVIDASGMPSSAATPPTQLKISAKRIVNFLAAMDEDDDTVNELSAALDKLEQKSHIVVESIPIKNGIKSRIEIQEGILILLGKLAGMSGLGGGGF